MAAAVRLLLHEETMAHDATPERITRCILYAFRNLDLDNGIFDMSMVNCSRRHLPTSLNIVNTTTIVAPFKPDKTVEDFNVELAEARRLLAF